MFVSALDILTGALGVFIILNFLNTRLASPLPPPPPPKIAAKEDKPDRPEAKTPKKREYRNNGQRGTEKYKPEPAPRPAPQPAAPQPKPEAPTPEPTPDNPKQEPVAVDLMKQTKGDVTLLLQQEGLAKQTVEFMLQQGSMTWKPSRTSKYQNDVFKYEKGLNYFYQVAVTPGNYDVYVRIKRRSRATGGQPFALYGKIIQPGMKTVTHNFGTFAAGSEEWIRAGTFTVLHNAISFKSALPEATADQRTPEPSATPPAKAPAPEQKKAGKWGK